MTKYKLIKLWRLVNKQYCNQRWIYKVRLRTTTLKEKIKLVPSLGGTLQNEESSQSKKSVSVSHAMITKDEPYY